MLILIIYVLILLIGFALIHAGRVWNAYQTPLAYNDRRRRFGRWLDNYDVLAVVGLIFWPVTLPCTLIVLGFYHGSKQLARVILRFT